MRRSLEKDLELAFRAALERMDLQGRTASALGPRALRGELPIVLVAIGKAAPRMAAGVLSRALGRVEQGLIVVSDGVPCDVGDPRVRVMRASHPLPDARSVRAAERALRLVRTALPRLILVLVSGGASALVCAPVPGLTLAKKRALVRALVRSGAPIAEINTVRRHLSRIKGGALLRAAWPNRVVTLIASDVIGGALCDIGSGPTVPDPTTRAEARRIVLRRAPELLPLPFVETLAPGDAAAQSARAIVVLSPRDFARETAHAIAERGYFARVLAPREGDVSELVAEYARRAAALRPGEALVRAAEPTLHVSAKRPGRGGRSGHLAALLVPLLPPGVAFLAGASDGVDGSSGAAGAVVNRASFSRISASIARDAMVAFDSGRLHARAHTAIVLPPTGQNFADVHVLARAM